MVNKNQKRSKKPIIPNGSSGIASASAVLFFAFTGYARIATLGEDVREAKKTIPRAIIMTLISSIIIYSLVTLFSLIAIGSEGMAADSTPLFSAVEAMNRPGVDTIIGIGAITAMLGVLLSQRLRTSRMFFAMGRRCDLPQSLSKVTKENRVPIYSILLSGLVILITIWTGELTFITQTASFTILVYYSIANLSALKLNPEDRFLPHWIAWAGLILCVLLAFSLPLHSILLGVLLLAIGHVARLFFKK